MSRPLADMVVKRFGRRRILPRYDEEATMIEKSST